MLPKKKKEPTATATLCTYKRMGRRRSDLSPLPVIAISISFRVFFFLIFFSSFPEPPQRQHCAELAALHCTALSHYKADRCRPLCVANIKAPLPKPKAKTTEARQEPKSPK